MLPSQKKVKLTIGLDPDVVAAAKAEGAGWQTRINATLRRHHGLERRQAARRRLEGRPEPRYNPADAQGRTAWSSRTS